jgi:hypothetical protein
VLDDINERKNYENHRLLSEDRGYGLLRHDPAHGGGYAVFRRLKAETPARAPSRFA